MKKTLLIIISIILTSFTLAESSNPIFENYYRAITNSGSTIQFYAVINLKDNETAEFKEVCLTGFDIYGMIADQNNIYIEDFKKITRKARINKKRNFLVTDSLILKRINRVSYTRAQLEIYKKRFNADSIAKSTIGNEDWYFYADNEKEQVMSAHLLFNEGIMVAINECMGGERLFLSDGY